jgi:hypothetical protein
MIEMRTDNYDLVRATRQHANDIGLPRTLYRLLGKILIIASRVREHLFQSGLSLLVIAGVLPQASFDDFPWNGLEAKSFRKRADGPEF